MGNIPLLLHSTVNLSSIISVLWPGFFMPLAITAMIISIVGLFGELPTFQWISVYYIEAFSSIALSALVCLIMVIIKIFIFGTYKIRVVEFLENREDEEREVRKAIEELTNVEDLNLSLIMNFLKWSYASIKTIRLDVSLFKGWNYLVIIWLIAINLYAIADFFGVHFLTTTEDWIYGVVVLSIALIFFIVGILLTWWVLWMDNKKPFGSSSWFFGINSKKNKPRSRSIRGENVWTMEVIAYIMQIPLFKCGLVFSYWLFYKYMEYTERISLLIGIGFFVVVDGLLIVLLKILKRWIGGTLMYAPEEREKKPEIFKELKTVEF